MNADDNPLVGYEARLAAFEIQELDSLYDAVVLVRETLDGMINQPRFEKAGKLSEAGKEVDLFISALNVYADAVHEAAVSASPKSPAEIDHRAWILLKHSVRCEEGLSQHLALAAELAVQYAAAKKIEARV